MCKQLAKPTSVFPPRIRSKQFWSGFVIFEEPSKLAEVLRRHSGRQIVWEFVSESHLVWHGRWIISPPRQEVGSISQIDGARSLWSWASAEVLPRRPVTVVLVHIKHNFGSHLCRKICCGVKLLRRHAPLGHAHPGCTWWPRVVVRDAVGLAPQLVHSHVGRIAAHPQVGRVQLPPQVDQSLEVVYRAPGSAVTEFKVVRDVLGACPTDQSGAV
mmetsp:Transcript_25208/g.75905  ORF Transcript_25208/g.75905 Transcript_25208/m.75905 type:complete len:214 (-) Transcript_25208:183-824(-)